MSEEPWSIGRLLDWTRGYFSDHKVDAPRVSAERLLAHVLGRERIELYTHIAQVPGPEKLAAFRQLVKRRAAQEPLEYLTGLAAFMGLEFVVDRRVLIPRPETELLVELTLDAVKAAHRETTLFDETEPGAGADPPTDAAADAPPAAETVAGPIVLDLCTGSGCVALSVAHYIKDATVHACDVSGDALAVAAENRARLKLEDRVFFHEGDLFAAFAETPDWKGRTDFILANPPYVAEADMATLEKNVRDFEPHVALSAGADGMDLHRRIVAEAGEWLADGGTLALEIAFNQAEAVAALFEADAPLADVRVIRDHQGHGRVVLARRAAREKE